MARQHITEDGPKDCNAEVLDCPVEYHGRSAPHFDNPEVAEKEYQKLLAQEFSAVGSVTKSPATTSRPEGGADRAQGATPESASPFTSASFSPEAYEAAKVMLQERARLARQREINLRGLLKGGLEGSTRISSTAASIMGKELKNNRQTTHQMAADCRFSPFALMDSEED